VIGWMIVVSLCSPVHHDARVSTEFSCVIQRAGEPMQTQQQCIAKMNSTRAEFDALVVDRKLLACEPVKLSAR
jgi:hypothetical protein